MTLDVFLALMAFCFVSSITPGPNNVMLFASGVNFGVWRTVPHMFGISIGFAGLLGCVGLGLGQVLVWYPPLFSVIKIAGVVYLLYLAWRIATSGPVKTGSSAAKPLTFVDAALFQWVNPKAWIMATTAMSLYTENGAFYLNVVIIIATFCLLNFPSISVWAVFGALMKRFLGDARKMRVFNIVMALLLVWSIWPMVS
jgi:threonine/homoserine/homoserine lactone efflux protein